MNAISALADTFNFVFIGLGTILHKFIHMNFAFVASLITSFGGLKESLSELVLPILNIIECYYQDFIIFLKELFSIARCIISVVSDFLYKLFCCVSYTVLLIQELGDIIHQNVSSYFTFVYSFALQIHQNAAYLMQLLFKSLLLILELGPNLLIFIYEVTLYCLCHLCSTVQESLESIIINLYGLCAKSKEAVFSIPIKAYLGILLFITIFYQYKFIIIYIKAYFLLLFLFLMHLGKQIYHFSHICVKPVIKITVNAFYKIKCVFISVEETSITDETESNLFVPEEGSVRENSFQICVKKVKTFFRKCYLNNRSHVEEQIENLQKELAAEREKHLCIICFDKPRTMILYPCRHMCVCEECCSALRAELQGCPLCRRDVLNFYRVFT